MQPKFVKIFGGGPSALIAADFLSSKFHVEIFEKEKNIGQKFLVAGKGGFNLTNNLDGNELADKYYPCDFLKNAILNFGSKSVREWLRNLNIETFTGTSGRVFAGKKYKPIDVLNSIRKSLIKKNVEIYTNHNFIGFDENNKPIVETTSKKFHRNEYYIFSLGGASWPNTGSDGRWLEHFNKIGISTNPFQASNCGINIKWPKRIIDHHVGKPLKNIRVKAGNFISSGEAVITNYGLEGNAIYSLIPSLRAAKNKGTLKISIDFKPNNSVENLGSKIRSTSSTSEGYKKLFNLNSTELSLLKSFTSKEEFTQPKIFVKGLKSLEIIVDSLRPIDESISTVGGIKTTDLNNDFSLKKYPNIYTIGEMVDWDAPTGGFLLQGCFSMGYHVADSLIKKNS